MASAPASARGTSARRPRRALSSVDISFPFLWPRHARASGSPRLGTATLDGCEPAAAGYSGSSTTSWTYGCGSAPAFDRLPPCNGVATLHGTRCRHPLRSAGWVWRLVTGGADGLRRGTAAPGWEPDMATPPTIAEGAKGHTVRWAQYLLVRRTLSYDQIDGIFGPVTKAAVEQFQKYSNLAVDGIVGPITWAALGGDGPEPPELERGSHGQVVERLQTALNDGRGSFTPSSNPLLV